MLLSASSGAWVCVPSPFEPIAGNVTTTARHHDHRRIICYLPDFKSYRLQEEQYLRLLFCYTTATFHAFGCQQWRLNSCTVAFWTHCWKRYHLCWAPRTQKDYVLLDTFQVLPATFNYTRTVSIPCWIHQLLSFHINTLKVEKFSSIVATHCWPVSYQQAFKPAVAGHSL